MGVISVIGVIEIIYIVVSKIRACLINHKQALLFVIAQNYKNTYVTSYFLNNQNQYK